MRSSRDTSNAAVAAALSGVLEPLPATFWQAESPKNETAAMNAMAVPRIAAVLDVTRSPLPTQDEPDWDAAGMRWVASAGPARLTIRVAFRRTGTVIRSCLSGQ